MGSDLQKMIKRKMAGEYSRELSHKVFAGQCRLIELGFRQGGPAGYGLRRQMIDQDRQPKSLLGPGERIRGIYPASSSTSARTCPPAAPTGTASAAW
uniref:hypothetical protein n=1 Tax=Azospirillum argentinense TaxID=2970906 RepID=UPI001586F33B